MSEHYYTAQPVSAHDLRQFEASECGISLRFYTDAGVFSRDGLDRGTALMIEGIPPLSGRVLDMGCGWGALGLFLKAKNPAIELTCADINARAVELTQKNAALNALGCAVKQSDGFAAIEGRFDAIVTNPPIRAGKKVIYSIFEGARAHLTEGGALYIVIQTKQGADSALKFLRGIYSEVEIIDRSGGFKLIRAAGANLRGRSF